jgi:type I restriction enzyme S subunit
MTSLWPKRPISELCTAIVDCVNRTAPLVDGPTPFRMIRTTNVRGGFIDLSSVRYVDEPTYLRWTRRQVPRRGDIVLTREAPLGDAGVIREDEGVFLGQRLVSYRANPELLDNRYLLYTLLGPSLQAQIQAFGLGSTVEHMRVPDAKKLIIPTPPIAEQHRIASILGAYDDLIEVNQRRIVLLEEMARRLFEEWFVHFRFPGHDGHTLVETPDGPLPEGWTNAPLSTTAKLVRGRSYRSVDLVEIGGLPFINLKCFLRDGGFREDGLKRYSGPYKADQMLNRGDIVMAVTDMTQERRIVGQAARVPQLDELPAVHSMDVVKIAPYPGISNTFLYHWLRFSGFSTKAAQRANGANVLHLSPSAIADFLVPIPDQHTQSLFTQHVTPINDQCDALQATEKRLALSRDLLLPRLISGELSVATAERELEAVA